MTTTQQYPTGISDPIMCDLNGGPLHGSRGLVSADGGVSIGVARYVFETGGYEVDDDSSALAYWNETKP